MRRVAVAVAALAIGVMRFCGRGRGPDDYDSIGFVRALDQFDLQKLQPHFPGYPVFVALGRLAHMLIASPLVAAQTVSAAAAAVTAVALWQIVAPRGGARAAATALALYAFAALPWLLGGAALSDMTATALAALAFAAFDGAPAASGLFIALMLGARASYWPIALSWGAAIWLWQIAAWRRAAVGAVAGTLLWLVPFLLLVGPSAALSLGRTHLHGHFTIWGGSIATSPGLWPRALAFARDLFLDGLVPHAWLLAAAAIVVASTRPRAPSAKALAVLALPYAAWAFFAQNIVEQPRHALPLVIGELVVLALWLAPHPRRALAVVALFAAASIPLVRARRDSAPAAAQAADWVAHQYAARDVAVFGGRAIRFFADGAPGVVTRPRTWLSEVDVELERLNRLPPHILVTSEVEVDPARAKKITDGPTFCRDARLDRQQPCLTLREYHLWPGR